MVQATAEKCSCRKCRQRWPHRSLEGVSASNRRGHRQQGEERGPWEGPHGAVSLSQLANLPVRLIGRCDGGSLAEEPVPPGGGSLYLHLRPRQERFDSNAARGHEDLSRRRRRPDGAFRRRCDKASMGNVTVSSVPTPAILIQGSSLPPRTPRRSEVSMRDDRPRSLLPRG